MNRVPVESSNLAEIGWEAGTLEVLFRSGATYRYDGVPEETYQMVLAGAIDGSVGKTFWELIARGGFEYRRLDDGQEED